MASIFIGNVLRREPVKIFGDGEQSRDFIHISDVVAAWIKAFGAPKAAGEAFNLGTGMRISVNRLVATDIRAFGLDPKAYPSPPITRSGQGTSATCRQTSPRPRGSFWA